MTLTIASRMAKLQRMAEHPTSNPNEAELARRELVRLQREYPAVRAKERTTARDRVNEVWSKSYELAIAEQRRRKVAGVLIIGEAGYNAWAGSLSVGDYVRIARFGVIVSWRTGNRHKIVRSTPSTYVLDNGAKFRRTGKHPGVKRGGGQDQMSYLVRDAS